jgi:hypothetical protein
VEWRRPKVLEKSPDIMPQVANFGIWLRGKNVVSPTIGEISSIPENVHFPSRNP